MEYSLTVRVSYDPLLNRGNNVILPESILNKLVEENKNLPCFFKFVSFTSVIFYAGCLQFTADEETVEIPYIMASTLGLEEYHVLNLNYIENIMACKYLTLEPQTEDFFSIPDYVNILQDELSQYSILSRNQIFHINYNDQLYFLKVNEIEPDTDEVNFAEYNQSGNQNCFLLIDQDVNTDIYDKFAVERYQKLQEEKEKQARIQQEKERTNRKSTDERTRL